MGGDEREPIGADPRAGSDRASLDAEAAALYEAELLAEATPAAEAEPLHEVEPPEPGPLGRLARIRGLFHIPRTRRGMAALLLVIGGIGTFFIAGATTVIAWTETADFCGRCHTMGPELTAHAGGPHADVTCGECHVRPGVGGWIQAKINGTRQLVEIVLGTFPEPIPPPDHDALPPPEETCLHCHSLDRLQTADLRTRTQYSLDEVNSRQFVGLMIRPGGGDIFAVDRSVHWHVLADVEFRADDESAQGVRWVRVTREDGTIAEYIRQDEIRLAEDVRPDIERIAAAGDARPMDCITCHNRVGHPLTSPRRGLDRLMLEGRIDPELPYIKREGMRVLWSNYPSEESAFAEIDRLESFYALRYPDVAESKSAEIAAAIEEIKVLYRLTATPEMRVTASTYPDNIGHADFPGCFRCHDGGHFLVENGVATEETIPSSCDTCHTFPQIGAVASLPLGIPPETHDDGLWVFNHRTVAPNLDPGGNTCGECHARDYCANCHATGAVTVDHDEMLTNHAAAIRNSSATACAYCHQPVYCARCHAEPVLPGSIPTGGISAIPGVEWGLIARAAPP